MKPFARLISLLACTPVFADSSINGVEAFRLGEYNQAVPALLQQKDPSARYAESILRLYGYGTLRNPQQALFFLTTAAEHGYLDAQNLRARIALIQEKNPEQALAWFQKAAQQGDTWAKIYCAGAYTFGYGTKKNVDLARRYLIDAARTGNALAQYGLAKDFLSTKGNQKMGFIWLNKAAEQQLPPAEFDLAHAYLSGSIGKKDPQKAQALLQRAAQQHYKPAILELATQAKTAGEVPQAIAYVHPLNSNSDLKNKKASAQQDFLNWLSNGLAQSFQDTQFQLTGILSPWKNPETLSSMRYNAAPARETIRGKDIYHAQFVMLEPTQIAIGDYFDAISPTLTTSIPLYQPQYSLPIDVQALLKHDSYIVQNDPNEPLIFKDATYQSLPPSPIYHALDTYSEGWQKRANYESVLMQYYEQAILGNPGAQFVLGQLYDEGIGVAQNRDQAIIYYGLAASQQDTRAGYHLGILYLHHPQDAEDYSKGLDWIADSAFKGDALAQYTLAGLYKTGLYDQDNKEVLAPNPEQATFMYYLASANQYGPAQYALANHLVQQPNEKLSIPAKQQRRNLIEKLYARAAQSGVAEAILPLAFYYAMDSDPKHQQQAFDIAAKYAGENDPNAAVLLGMMYERGIATAPNTAKALYWYQQNPNNPVSSFILGTYYAQGHNVSLDRERAQQLLDKAAHASLSYAQYNLAILKKEAGVPFLPDLEAARAAGNPSAGLLLADYYLEKSQDPATLKEAQDIYQYFASKGDPVAQYKLGYLFDAGVGMNRQPEQALAWYEQSAQQGYPQAQYSLASLYQSGRTSDPDAIKKAEFWFTQALKKEPKAEVALGVLLEMQNGDYRSAEEHYQAAAKTGNSLAEYDLGLIYDYGKGVNPDPIIAQKWYLAAAEQGHSQAMTQLAQLLMTSDAPKNATQVAYWYKKAADLGNAEALYQMGKLTESGTGTKVDYPQTIAYYEKASQKGHLLASLTLAHIYQIGLLNVPADPAKTIHYYRMVADLGIPYAQYQVGLLLTKSDIESPDYKQGLNYLKTAAQQGYQKAQERLSALEAKINPKMSHIAHTPSKG
ncbi:MAG: tetratricopeptide repeat protein [Legionellaceae bacterium]|nr:tetratricopeptide repeat protein [Legionellaceae bacterium]